MTTWKKLLVVFAACAILAPAAAAAQQGPRTGLPSDAELRLKQSIQSSFRVLSIRDGIILVPLSRRPGVDNVELREGAIAVNGTVVTGGELRQRLGRDADSVLELSYLDTAAQRRLLLGEAGAPATPAAPSVEPPAAPEQSPAATPVEAEDHRTFRRVSHGRVRVGGSITVDEDEEVTGDVVAIGGTVAVDGRVRGAVVAVGGEIRIGPKAEIDGDVTSVGGAVVRDAAASVHGQVNEVDLRLPHFRVRPFPVWGFHVDPWWSGTPWRAVRLFGTLVRMGLFTVLAAIVLLLAPRAVERVDRTVRTAALKAGLVGFFAQLVFAPLLVVTVVFLVISIIGIPLLVLVPFAILAFVVAFVLGFAGTATAVAHAARDRFRWETPAPFAMLVVGLLLIWGITLVARIVSMPGGPFALIGGIIALLGFVVEYVAWTVGLGGAILTRFGRVGPLTPPPIPPVDVEAPIE